MKILTLTIFLITLATHVLADEETLGINIKANITGAEERSRIPQWHDLECEVNSVVSIPCLALRIILLLAWTQIPIF